LAAERGLRLQGSGDFGPGTLQGTMRPKQRQTTGSSDLSRARLDQIINMKHELVQLAGKLDWAWIGGGCGEAACPLLDRPPILRI
jgi:hypothetical protein